MRPSVGSLLRRSLLVPTLTALLVVGSAGPVVQHVDHKVAPQESIDARRAVTLPFLTGMVANEGPVEATTDVQTLGSPAVRLEFPIETPPAVIRPFLDAYARTGTRALLLAGFSARMPSEDSARGLAQWAAAFGPASGRPLPIAGIELGNETSYVYQYGDGPSDESYVDRARAYAGLVAAAGAALRSADPDVPLLAQADDGGTASAVWVDTMFAAVPNLADVVTGWTIHPYGPAYIDRIERARAQLGAHDAVRPLWITEWGLAVDGGRCLNGNYGWDRCMSEDTAADTLLQVVGDLRPFDIAAFFVYQARDQRPPGTDTDRERYFGVQTSTGDDKGSYTRAVRALWPAP